MKNQPSLSSQIQHVSRTAFTNRTPVGLMMFAGVSASALAGLAGLAHGQSPLPVLVTNFGDVPTSLVPAGVGVTPGLRFDQGRSDISGNPIFQKTNQSPNGAYWTLSGTVDTTVGTNAVDTLIDEVIIVGSNLLGGPIDRRTVSRENSPFPASTTGIVAGEGAGIVDLDVPINDAGEFALTTLLRFGASSANAVVMRGTGVLSTSWSVVAREGSAIPGLAGQTFGTRQFGVDIAADGKVVFNSERLNNSAVSAGQRGVFTDLAPVIVLPGGVGATPVNDPSGLGGNWGSFASPIQTNGTGSSYLIRGFIAGFSDFTDDVVALNNNILLRNSGALNLNIFTQTYGGFDIDPLFRSIDRIDRIDMADSGKWMIGARFLFGEGQFLVFGENLTYENRLVARGTPLFAGATENWGEVTFAGEPQPITFTNAQINSAGQFAATGFSDNVNAGLNGVLVFNGQCVLAREGDPVDLNNNGVADDNAFLLGFREDTMSLSGTFTTPGTVMVTADVRRPGANPDGSEDVFGSVVLRLRAQCCPADVGTEGGAEGSDGTLDNNDFIVFIGWFFGQDPRADIGSEGGADGSDGAWDNNDFILFIQRFFDGC
jgi:hypothetical protein